MRIVFVMVVGPGEARIALNTLTALWKSHPESLVFIRDDATTDGTGETLEAWARQAPGAIVLRASTPYGYRGIARSLFEVISHVASTQSGDDWMLVKVDPDTLLIGSELTDSAARYLSAHGPGLVGAVRTGPAGPRDPRRERRNMLIDVLPVGPSKTGSKLRLGWPFWATHLRRAARLGYRTGVGVQGGLIILHGRSVRALAEEGFWDAIDEGYRALTYEEDILVSLGVASVGHRLHELADLGVPWWVQHKPPLPFDADEAVRRGLRVIHPLKDDQAGWAIREALQC